MRKLIHPHFLSKINLSGMYISRSVQGERHQLPIPSFPTKTSAKKSNTIPLPKFIFAEEKGKKQHEQGKNFFTITAYLPMQQMVANYLIDQHLENMVLTTLLMRQTEL